MSCLQNEILLEQWYEEALAETLKEYKDVAKAEEEASRWNTGVVVDYKTKHILPFTQEKRKRAAERAKANSND